jgi:hypothetical protein
MQPTPRDQDSTPRAPHEPISCKTDRGSYPCACDGATYTLADVASLVQSAEWPRPAQRRVLEFALALPPELISDFWRVVWTVDAARMDTEQEEDALEAVYGRIAARAGEEASRG